MTEVKNISHMRLITIHLDERVENALLILKTYHIRHLPVVNDQKEVVGVLSDRDLLFNIAHQDKKISEVMKKNLITVDVKDDLKIAIKKMIDQKISAVLVTKNEKISGIVTTEDLMWLLMELLDKDSEAPVFLENYVNLFKDYLVSAKNPNYV